MPYDMTLEDPDPAAIVECTNCGTAGFITFGAEGITAIVIPCKCPRPTIDQANAAARKKLAKKGS